MSKPSHQVKFKYTGSALPGNAEVVSFFDTTVANGGMGANWCDTNGVARILVRLINSQAGTLTMEVSTDRGSNWTTISTNAVAISSANSENDYDFLVEGLPDVRIRWTNGATPQTVFVPIIVGTDLRHIAN